MCIDMNEDQILENIARGDAKLVMMNMLPNTLKTIIESDVNQYDKVQERNGWIRLYSDIFCRKIGERSSTLLQIAHRRTVYVSDMYVEKKINSILSKLGTPDEGAYVRDVGEFRTCNVLIKPIGGLTGQFRWIECRIPFSFESDDLIDMDIE